MNVNGDFKFKIADFGKSKAIETYMPTYVFITICISTFLSLSLSSKAGADYFESPEVASKIYSTSCDIWSFGIVFQCLCTISYLTLDLPKVSISYFHSSY